MPLLYEELLRELPLLYEELLRELPVELLRELPVELLRELPDERTVLDEGDVAPVRLVDTRPVVLEPDTLPPVRRVEPVVRVVEVLVRELDGAVAPENSSRRVEAVVGVR